MVSPGASPSRSGCASPLRLGSGVPSRRICNLAFRMRAQRGPTDRYPLQSQVAAVVLEGGGGRVQG